MQGEVIIVVSWGRWAMRVISDSGKCHLKLSSLFQEIRYYEMFYEDQRPQNRTFILLETLMDFEWKRSPAFELWDSRTLSIVVWLHFWRPIKCHFAMEIFELVPQPEWDYYSIFSEMLISTKQWRRRTPSERSPPWCWTLWRATRVEPGLGSSQAPPVTLIF